MQQISDTHSFTKSEWPGGYDSLPIIPTVVKKTGGSHKRHIVSRRRNPTNLKASKPTLRVHSSPKKPSKGGTGYGSNLHIPGNDPSSLVPCLVKQVEDLTGRILELENKLKSNNLRTRLYSSLLNCTYRRRFRRKSSHISAKKLSHSVINTIHDDIQPVVDEVSTEKAQTPNPTPPRMEMYQKIHLQLTSLIIMVSLMIGLNIPMYLEKTQLRRVLIFYPKMTAQVSDKTIRVIHWQLRPIPRFVFLLFCTYFDIQ